MSAFMNLFLQAQMKKVFYIQLNTLYFQKATFCAISLMQASKYGYLKLDHYSHFSKQFLEPSSRIMKWNYFPRRTVNTDVVIIFRLLELFKL